MKSRVPYFYDRRTFLSHLSFKKKESIQEKNDEV
jgi:hypothetical protein